MNGKRRFLDLGGSAGNSQKGEKKKGMKDPEDIC